MYISIPSLPFLKGWSGWTSASCASIALRALPSSAFGSAWFLSYPFQSGSRIRSLMLRLPFEPNIYKQFYQSFSQDIQMKRTGISVVSYNNWCHWERCCGSKNRTRRSSKKANTIGLYTTFPIWYAWFQFEPNRIHRVTPNIGLVGLLLFSLSTPWLKQFRKPTRTLRQVRSDGRRTAQKHQVHPQPKRRRSLLLVRVLEASHRGEAGTVSHRRQGPEEDVVSWTRFSTCLFINGTPSRPTGSRRGVKGEKETSLSPWYSSLAWDTKISKKHGSAHTETSVLPSGACIMLCRHNASNMSVGPRDCSWHGDGHEQIRRRYRLTMAELCHLGITRSNRGIPCPSIWGCVSDSSK